MGDIIDRQDKKTPESGHRLRRRLWLWILAAPLILILLFAGAVGFAVLWLTPERLSALVGREASEMLDADVSVGDIRYTLWSSWPRLRVECDTVHVRSRVFDSVPAAARRNLPPGSDFLLSTGRVEAELNLLKLMHGKIWMKDVEISEPDINLVALSDTLKNYDIVTTQGRERVPEFRIDGMRLIGGGNIDYTSVPSHTKARVALGAGSLSRSGSDLHEPYSYQLALGGKVSVESGKLALLTNFPISLSGDVKVGFEPFSISTTDYDIILGDVKGRMSMDMEIGDDVKLNNLDYRLEDVSLMQLLTSVPGIDAPLLERIRADVDIDCSARLTTPYSFSSVWLPSVEVDFRVPEGELAYTLADGEEYRLDRVSLEGGRLLFDGHSPEDSYVDIPDISLVGMGVDAHISGRVTDLTGNPGVQAELRGRCDLGRLAKKTAMLRGYRPEGDAEMRAVLSFRLDGSTLYGSVADVEVKSGYAKIEKDGTQIALRGLHCSSGGSYADGLTMRAVEKDIPLHLAFTADRLSVLDHQKGVDFRMRGVRGEGDLSAQRGAARKAGIAVRGDSVALAYGGMAFSLAGVDARLTGWRGKSAPTDNRQGAASCVGSRKEWDKDSAILRRLEHTPQYLSMTATAPLARFAREADGSVDLRIARGSVSTAKYTDAARFSALDMNATPDSVRLRSLEVRSGATRGRLTGMVSGLRGLLAGESRPRINAAMDMAFDTIQFNELARRFAGESIMSGSGDEQPLHDDSITWLIPRNLHAKVGFSADMTQYINLRFEDLSGAMEIADGNAEVRGLRIGSDFGHAEIGAQISTSDAERMRLSADVAVLDINVVNFFKNFHSLVETWPELNNLSGTLSARLRGDVGVFPSMYVDVPSLWADAHVSGRRIELKQNRFIHKVVRALMIHTDEPLRVRDMDIHAGVHDNLLEVFPFTFEMCDYKLRLQGLNNFDGDLFYHIGVDRWPLKIPFGVNIKGQYHDPKIRLGGAHWHDQEGAKITVGVEDHNRLNMIREFRKYGKTLVKTAADYRGE